MREMKQNEALEAFKVAAAHTPTRRQSMDQYESSSSLDDHENDPKVMKLVEEVEEQLSMIYDHNHQNEYPCYSKSKRPNIYPCCTSAQKGLPSEPSKWPQKPIMLCPAPAGGTVVRGIRLADSKDYHDQGFCSECILPINNGTESKGGSRVIDFESELFVGTLLLRIREAPLNNLIAPTNQVKQDFNNDYFEGKKRRFQAVVKGKFKKELKMSECVTGQVFNRPAGNLPAKWITSSFIKFISILSPQLEVNLFGDEPRFLAPLAATAMTVIEEQEHRKEKNRIPTTDLDLVGEDNVFEDTEVLVNNNLYSFPENMEDSVEEPLPTDSTSLMQQAKQHHGIPITTKKNSTIMLRQQARKKAFNAIYAKRAAKPTFRLDKEYTFEFYQHLLLFDDTLALDMGRVIGKVPLGPVLNGQPIKFNAACKGPDGKLSYLWDFDIWHEDLYESAVKAANEVPREM